MVNIVQSIVQKRGVVYRNTRYRAELFQIRSAGPRPRIIKILTWHGACGENEIERLYKQKMRCLRAFHKFELSADKNHTFSLLVHSLRALGMTRFEAVDHQQ
jgi:hypothetical protein